MKPPQDMLSTGMIRRDRQGDGGLLVGTLCEADLSAASFLSCPERHRRRIQVPRLGIVRIFGNEVPCQGFAHLEETLPSVLLRLCPPDMNGLDREVQGLVEGEWIVGVVIV